MASQKNNKTGHNVVLDLKSFSACKETFFSRMVTAKGFVELSDVLNLTIASGTSQICFCQAHTHSGPTWVSGATPGFSFEQLKNPQGKKLSKIKKELFGIFQEEIPFSIANKN